MAEEHKREQEIPISDKSSTVETKDRGLFDFMGKKEGKKPEEEVIAGEFEQKVRVSESEPQKEEKKHGILEKLHRSDSSSSSSSDEEGGDEEKKKKKKEKKGLKEKIKEKISGEKTNEAVSVPVPVEKHEEVVHTETAHQPAEKKGFLEKIKEKLPGQNRKTEEFSSPTPPPAVETHEEEAKEKKGILEKIKEKLPRYHPKAEEEKEKGKESD